MGERGAGTRRGREERPHLDPRRHPAGIFWFIDHSEGCCHPVRLVGSAVCIRTIHSCSSCTEGTRSRWKRNGKRHRGRRCQWHDLLREGGEMCCDRGRGCTGSDRVLLVGRRRGGYESRREGRWRLRRRERLLHQVGCRPAAGHPWWTIALCIGGRSARWRRWVPRRRGPEAF